MGPTPRFIELDEASAFARVRESPGAVLMYITSAGCADCEELARALEALVHRYPGPLICGHLDRRKAPAFAKEYGVLQVPTLLLVHRGRVLSRLVGPTCVDPLLPALQSLIERSAAAA